MSVVDEALERRVRSQAAIDAALRGVEVRGGGEVDVGGGATVGTRPVARGAVEDHAVDSRRRSDVGARNVAGEVAGAVGRLRAGKLLRTARDPALCRIQAACALIGAAEAVDTRRDRRERLGVLVGDDTRVIDQDVAGVDPDGAGAHLEHLAGLRVHLHVGAAAHLCAGSGPVRVGPPLDVRAAAAAERVRLARRRGRVELGAALGPGDPRGERGGTRREDERGKCAQYGRRTFRHGKEVHRSSPLRSRDMCSRSRAQNLPRAPACGRRQDLVRSQP